MNDVSSKNNTNIAPRRVPPTIGVCKVADQQYFSLVIPSDTSADAFNEARRKMENLNQDSKLNEIGLGIERIGDNFSYYFNGLNGTFRAVETIENNQERAEIGQAVLDDLLAFVQNTRMPESDHFSISFAKLAKIIWDAQPTTQNADQFIAFEILQGMCHLQASSLEDAETLIPLYIALHGDISLQKTKTDLAPAVNYIHPEVQGAIAVLRQYPDLPGRFVKEIKAWHRAAGESMGMESRLDERAVATKLLTVRPFKNVAAIFESVHANDPEYAEALAAEGYVRRAKLKLAERTPEGKMTRNHIEAAYTAICKAHQMRPDYEGVRPLKALLENKFPWLNKADNSSIPHAHR
jgi:hypothetical protein